MQGADAAVLDAVRDAAAEAGVGIRELQPAVPTVEDILVGAMEEVLTVASRVEDLRYTTYERRSPRSRRLPRRRSPARARCTRSARGAAGAGS